MFRSYGTFGACLLAVYVIFELSLLVRAASSDGSAGQVRFVSSSAEYDSELVWNVPSDDPVPIASSNALKICDCEYALPRYHGGLLCNKEGYFITNFEAVGHWVRPTCSSQSKTCAMWFCLCLCMLLFRPSIW